MKSVICNIKGYITYDVRKCTRESTTDYSRNFVIDAVREDPIIDSISDFVWDSIYDLLKKIRE